MKWDRKTRILAALLASCNRAWTTTGEAANVAVIVHLSNVTQSLSNSELRDVLLGKINQWPDRRNVTVVERDPGSPVMNAVLRKCLNLSLDDYTRQLIALEFRGKRPPAIKVLRSDDGACSFVFNVPGAIGFVSERSLSLPSCHDQVKILQVSGMDVRAPGYPLTMETR